MKKLSTRRHWLNALCLGLGLMGLTAQAQQALPAGYKAEYRMSTVVGTAFPWGKGADIWANLVRERTQGRINIKMYPGVSMEQTFPWVWWLVLAMMVSMLAVLFFPPLALWLPQYLGY